jgi:hypothetical protein
MNTPLAESASGGELARDLGLSRAGAIVIGTIIGSGIFLLPAEIDLLSVANDRAGEALRRLGLDVYSTALLIGTEGATDPDIYEELTTPGTANISEE